MSCVSPCRPIWAESAAMAGVRSDLFVRRVPAAARCASTGGRMDEAGGNLRDSSGAAVRPPIAWALTVVIGLALDWLYPLPFLPAAVPGLGRRPRIPRRPCPADLCGDDPP